MMCNNKMPQREGNKVAKNIDDETYHDQDSKQRNLLPEMAVSCL